MTAMETKTPERTMYQACLMHSRAERVLKTIVAKHLKQYKITRMEWIVISTLDAGSDKAGYTMSSLSKILDIKLSQLTILVTGTCKLGLSKQVTSPNDRRIKLVTITPKGKKLVDKTEQTMRTAMREWLSSIPRDKLSAYMQTLDMLGKIS